MSTTLEIVNGIEIEVLITDFNNFPEEIENAEVIRSKKTNSAFINKKFFGFWIAKYLKEIPLDTLSILFTRYKNREGLRRVCLWFLGEEFFYFEEVLRESKKENSISSVCCKKVIEDTKSLSIELARIDTPTLERRKEFFKNKEEKEKVLSGLENLFKN